MTESLILPIMKISLETKPCLESFPWIFSNNIGFYVVCFVFLRQQADRHTTNEA